MVEISEIDADASPPALMDAPDGAAHSVPHPNKALGSAKQDKESGAHKSICFGSSLSCLDSLDENLAFLVVSFMTARDMVRASVLSKVWNAHWKYVKSLIIDEEEFRSSDGSDNLRRFEIATTQLTTGRNIHFFELQKFQLCITRESCEGEVGLYATNMIRELITKYPNRWNLRTLYLRNVRVERRFSRHIRKSCLLLEDLGLTGCFLEFGTISSLSLKRLVIKNSYWMSNASIQAKKLETLVIDGGSNKEPLSLLSICASAVKSLHLIISSFCFGGGVYVEDMPSIYTAKVRFWGLSAGRGMLTSSRLRLINGLGNVTQLNLHSFETMVHVKPLVFPNLQVLKLERCELDADFRTLLYYIQSSPVLQKLSLFCCKFSEDSDAIRGNIPESVNCKCIKLIEITYEDSANNSDDAIRRLVTLLLDVLEKLSMDDIKLIKIGSTASPQ